MAGRKKIPTKLKLLKGTHRPERENPNEPDPLNHIPEPPEHLSEEAREEWNRISKELDVLGLVSEIDRAALAMYCQAWGRVMKYEKIIADKGELFKTTNGNIQISPAMSVLNQSIKQCHQLLTEFGMTPSSRASVSAKKPEKKNTDPFGNLEAMGQ